MNMSFNNADGWMLALFTIVSYGIVIMWLYLAYRAMKAHERLAAAAEKLAHRSMK